MKGKTELGVTPTNSWKDELNKSPNRSKTKKGQKLQTTARFEKSTIETLEDIADNNGFSLAEAIRRLVRIGLQNYKPARELVHEDLEGLLGQADDESSRGEIAKIQSDLFLHGEVEK
ncbi:hypothetical protein AQV86_00900 [Nanohaloarchaea archaeon SG9]|nr:hypothetical protein AQV86_00900 [Nanohaloarchaea archaeon SG9]